MPLVTDAAICLRATPFSETSQIVTLLTRDRGRLRLLAKGATRRTKAGKGKFDGGLDLLDAGDATFNHQPERDLSLLTEWRLRDGHRGLRGELRAAWLGLYAAELVDKLLEEQDPHPRLFDQFSRLLARLAEPAAREAVALAFALNLLRQAGLLPDFNRCRLGGGGFARVSAALAEGRPVGLDLERAEFVAGDEGEPVRRAFPNAVAVPAGALSAMLSLLGLTRGGRPGGGLPEVPRPDADAAHRVLVAHVQRQIESRLRTARYVTGS